MYPYAYSMQKNAIKYLLYIQYRCESVSDVVQDHCHNILTPFLFVSSWIGIYVYV